MKRALNLLFVAGLLVAGMSVQLACKSTKKVTVQKTTQPAPKPKIDLSKPPQNPFKNDTTQTPRPAPPKMIELGTIHFAFDKSNIDDPDARLLAENVKKLQSNPRLNVTIDAYTDHIGGDQYNLRLSERRAKAVQEFYTNNGIAANRITARGLGKAPVACMKMDTDGPGCRKNRRAESHIDNQPGQ